MLSTYDSVLRALFEGATSAGANPNSVANWVTGEVVASLRRSQTSLSETPLTADHLADLIGMIDASVLSNSAAKDVLAGVMDGEGDPSDVATARDLVQISDTGALETAVDLVIGENPDDFERLRGGEQKLIGFFVGQVMRKTGGKADPKIVSELIRSRAES